MRRSVLLAACAALALGLAVVPALAEEPPAPVAVDASAGAAGGSGGTLFASCQDEGPIGAAEADTSLQGRVKDALASGDLVLALILVLFGGFLTALSPCVYPLIPITLSILGARQATSHLRGFAIAGTYVLGMVILYSALGVGFAAAGVLAGSMLQSPLVTVGFALLCFAMAASMFGAFEVRLPSGLQTRLSQAGGSGFKGAFIMGLVAGIIAAPCTGPVLSFILTLIARDGDLMKGALLMVVYALGMGAPFLVLGTFSTAISRLPKSGRWMEVVKGVFGLLMIGAGLYYVRLGFPAFAALFAALGGLVWLGPALILAGVAAGALHLSFKMSQGLEKARKALGVALAVSGLAAFLAWTDAGPGEVKGEAPPIAWQVITASDDAADVFDRALAVAKASCRPAMIDFFAEWCLACKELDHKTYVVEAVRKEAQRFTSIKIDATDEHPQLEELQKRFGIVGLPTIVFVDKKGRVLKEPQVTGFIDAEAYARVMKRVR
ncbi:MAG: sulfite exporter TauE/SafE family protein [Deltaproteobacteria bacterium]|nr:sulfite exporter TauE/SafE family protein [Deltaproteobacteria bacterium]